MSALLSIGWNPEFRGIISVLIGVVVMPGSVYLLLGTNLGTRLGFLVAIAGLASWMAMMGLIWWVYGIGLMGTSPSWKPAAPLTIIRDAEKLDEGAVLETPFRTDSTDFPTIADEASAAIQAAGWTKLPEADPGRGQAIASSDEIIQIEAEMYTGDDYQSVAVYSKGGERWPKINDSLDFLAFRHTPHYVLVEIAPVVPQRDEPGRAPARPVIDDGQPHQYVLMIRDLGTRRQPAMVLTVGGGLIFALCCWLLHRRDAFVARNRSMAVAKA